MQQRMMRGAKRALAMAAVCLLAVASACTGPKLAADSFDDFCTRVIREMVGEDYVTIHFFFDDPDALGLGDVAPTFGRYTAEADEEEAERSAAMIRDLMRYDRDTLSQSQKKTYDLLLWTLQSAVPAAPMYYENPNAPNFGWQAQIQISLAELALDTEEDVENYLALLSDMPRYAGAAYSSPSAPGPSPPCRLCARQTTAAECSPPRPAKTFRILRSPVPLARR